MDTYDIMMSNSHFISDDCCIRVTGRLNGGDIGMTLYGICDSICKNPEQTRNQLINDHINVIQLYYITIL